MEILCEKEATRLFFYHLSQVFFHENTELFRIEPKIEREQVRVRIENGKTESIGTEGIDLSLHLEPSRSTNVALGKAFAKAARAFTDYIPPYGTLIGVRPVKVAVYYLKNGQNAEETKKILEREYFVSPEKARLLCSLAETELAFEKELTGEDGMLYLSIPFCPGRCSYCSFISSAAPDHLAMIPKYLELMKEEIKLTAALFQKKGKRLRGVYMGGGTPGILSAHQLSDVLGFTKECFDFTHCREFCVEIGRPDTVTEEKLSVLNDLSVNRISINPQTTCDETLNRIGRGHSAKQFFDAMAMASEFSFQINCDLISALPGETPEVFLKSVREVLSLSPANVTIHALCRKKSARDREEKAFSSNFANAMETARELCMKNGLAPYYLYRQKMSDGDLENLGFAKPHALGIYNLAMMEDLCDIFACGAGGIGKLLPRKSGERIRRFAAFKYPFEYLQSPERIRERILEMEAF